MEGGKAVLPSSMLLVLWREEWNHGSNCGGLVRGVGPAGGADKQSGRRERDGRAEKKMGLDFCLEWRLRVSFLPLVGWTPPASLRGLW